MCLLARLIQGLPYDPKKEKGHWLELLGTQVLILPWLACASPYTMEVKCAQGSREPRGEEEQALDIQIQLFLKLIVSLGFSITRGNKVSILFKPI